MIYFVALLINAGYAQKAAKSVYFELGDAGLASLNYDMRFSKKESGFGFRVGAGGFTETNNYGYGSGRNAILTIPLELNYLPGKGGRHYAELGAGGYTHIRVKCQYLQWWWRQHG